MDFQLLVAGTRPVQERLQWLGILILEYQVSGRTTRIELKSPPPRPPRHTLIFHSHILSTCLCPRPLHSYFLCLLFTYLVSLTFSQSSAQTSFPQWSFKNLAVTASQHQITFHLRTIAVLQFYIYSPHRTKFHEGKDVFC